MRRGFHGAWRPARSLTRGKLHASGSDSWQGSFFWRTGRIPVWYLLMRIGLAVGAVVVEGLNLGAAIGACQ